MQSIRPGVMLKANGKLADDLYSYKAKGNTEQKPRIGTLIGRRPKGNL